MPLVVRRGYNSVCKTVAELGKRPLGPAQLFDRPTTSSAHGRRAVDDEVLEGGHDGDNLGGRLGRGPGVEGRLRVLFDAELDRLSGGVAVNGGGQREGHV